MSLVSRDVPIRYEPDFWPSCYERHTPIYRDPIPYENGLSRYDDFYSMPYGFESRPLMRSQMWSSFEREMARMNEEMKRNWAVSRRVADDNFAKMGDNFLAPSAENWRLMENFRMDNPITEDRSGRRKFYLEYDTSQFKPEEITVKTSGQQLTVHAKHEEKDENRSSRKEYLRSYLLPKEVNPELLTSKLSETGKLTITASLPALAFENKERLIAIEHTK
ncbi:alpha-crystallin B chain-like [Mytilus californianus]|uniref:alpha-crystallin B chain-like n=1 Tax=Mytilus californianus TaxID=6549 RepID=UPI002247AABA|nr:alpha-crystallin B chain-like [Mytilus californianus]